MNTLRDQPLLSRYLGKKNRPLAELNDSTVSTNSAESSHNFHRKSKLILEQAMEGELLVGYERKYDYNNGNLLVDGQIYISAYRIVITVDNNQRLVNIPLCSLENVEAKEDVSLNLIVKDGRIIRLKASNREAVLELLNRLIFVSTAKRSLKDIFAFTFHKECELANVKWMRPSADHSFNINSPLHPLQREFAHLRLDPSKWRITKANSNFEICETYPEYLIVPQIVTDKELAQLAPGRFMKRFPACVWRDTASGGLLFRSAQPKINWIGTVSQDDVKYIEQLAHINDDEVLSNDIANSTSGQTRNQKMLILDMRSYAAAWANRAKGGGFESSETYPNTEIVFMSLGNIHEIRHSFTQLRNLLNTPEDPNVLITLNSTQWLQFISAILRAAVRCQEAVMSGRTVLVHCSDGWDRTTQIVSLCKLLADPYYRTFEGFAYLVQREWVEFGHKFADRNGILNADPNEFAPIFMQWLDSVHQIWNQNQTAFEFNRRYLTKLAQHSYSGLFGTFLFNNMKEAKYSSVDSHTSDILAEPEFSTINSEPSVFSVWDYLGRHNREFRNVFYNAGQPTSILKCNYDLLNIRIWRDVYKTSDIERGTNTLVVEPTSPSDETEDTVDPLSFMDKDGLTRVPLDEDAYQIMLKKR